MKQPTKDELYAAADEAYNLGFARGYLKGWEDAGRDVITKAPAVTVPPVKPRRRWFGGRK